MSESQEDYWPQDLGKTGLDTPAALMGTQAALLGQKTNQQITATVQALGGSPAEFVWSFQLLSAALGNYRYELFRVFHPLTLYPATIQWEGHPNKAVGTHEEFKDALKEILGSDRTKRIVEALLAQVIR